MPYTHFSCKRKASRMQILIKKGEWNFIWVKDFPMFDWSEEEQKLNAMHHPFTSPKKEDLELIEKEPLKVRSTRVTTRC